MNDSIETSENEAVTPMTAERIVSMIHPDLLPATAHFLLNEAKPLLVELEQLRAELAAIKAQEPVIDFTVLYEYANNYKLNYNQLCAAVRSCVSAAPVAPAQPVNAELVEALKDALHSMESFAVSCQDGVVTSCKCRACVLDRGNAALANAKAAPKLIGVAVVARVLEQTGPFEARIEWLHNPVPVGEELQWDHGSAAAPQQEQKGGE